MTSGRQGLRPAWLLAATAVLLATAAGNLGEADDAYAFAWRVEQVGAWQFDDPRLLGYHLLARGLWSGAQALGWHSLRGLELLRAISWLAAIGCLALTWRVLHRRLELPAEAALLGTAALAACYGFWRYAVEADVYALALCSCAFVLDALLAPSRRPRTGSLGLGALAGVAVLVYQPNAIALLLVFPLLAWARRGAGAALAYAAGAAATLAAGYGAAFLAWWPDVPSVAALQAFLAQRSGEFAVPPLSLRVLAASALRSSFALGHDIVSTNWAFGFEPVHRLALRLFGSHQLAEEVFTARHAGAWVWVGLGTALLWLLASVRLLRSAGRPAAARWRPPAMLAIGAWALASAAVVGRLNPGGTEAWIVVLLPLALLFAGLVLAPAVERGGSAKAAGWVLALAAHNAAGGIALVQDPAGDLVGLRCRGIAAQAQRGDLVLVIRETLLAECLRYRGPAEALTISLPSAALLARSLAADEGVGVASIGRASHAGRDVTQLARERLNAGQRVWVLGDFFDLAPLQGFHIPEHAEALEALQQRSPRRFTLPDGTHVHALQQARP